MTKISEYTSASLPLRTTDLADISEDLTGSFGTRKLTLADLAENVLDGTLGFSGLYYGDGTLTSDRTVSQGGNNFILSGGFIGLGGYTVGSKVTVRGDNALSSQSGLRVENDSSVPLFLVQNDGHVSVGGVLTSNTRFEVRGADNLGSSNCALFENASGTDLFKIQNDGLIDIGTSSTYRVNVGASATGGGIFIGGTSTGAGLNSVGSFTLAAGYFSNSVGEALRTVAGNVRLVSASGNVGISGFFDSNYKMNIEAGASNGGLTIRGTANSIAAINVGLTGLGTNIASSFSSVNGTNNVALQTVSGDNKLNTSGGSTAIGKTLGSTISADALLELESTTQGFKIMQMTATEASAITATNGLMLYVTNTNGTFTSVGFWGYENGAWVKL